MQVPSKFTGGPPPVGPFLTVPEAAKILGLSTRSTWALIAAGRLKPVRFGPRATRVSADALREFVESCEEGR